MAVTRFDPRSLDADSIIAEARERIGLHDFGDESFLEPMRRMLAAYETEADLNARTTNVIADSPGGDPDKVSGTRKEHVLTASGVLIQS